MISEYEAAQIIERGLEDCPEWVDAQAVAARVLREKARADSRGTIHYAEALDMANKRMAKFERDLMQFNDGYEAAKTGKHDDEKPAYEIDEDSWHCGFAWFMYDVHNKRIAELEKQLALALDEVERCEWLLEMTTGRICRLTGHAFSSNLLLGNRPAAVTALIEQRKKEQSCQNQ